MKKNSELAGLKNIGPTIEKRLNEIGIKSRSDLEKVGAANAYRMIRDRNPARRCLSATTCIRCRAR